MRDRKPRIVEREILEQVSEDVLIDPMQNNEVVRPTEVVDEEVDHVIDEGARTNVVNWVERIGVMIEQCGVVLDVVIRKRNASDGKDCKAHPARVAGVIAMLKPTCHEKTEQL